MSNRVKQHFVPQFYFRNFTEDESLRTLNIESEERHPPTPIKNICYERYFYGKDGELEDALQLMENEIAPIIHDIASTRSLREVMSNQKTKFLLDLFITHLEARTKAAREESEELTHHLFTQMVEVGVEAGELEEDHLSKVQAGEIRLEGPDHSLKQLHSFYAPLHIADLNQVLIENRSSIEFVTSDNPVYFDNPRFKNTTELGTNGYAVPGLQIYCPISSDLILLYYDAECYRIRTSDHRVTIEKNNVIQRLNNIQLINCLENAYFSDETTGKLLSRACHSMKRHRPSDKIHSREGRKFDTQTGRESELIVTRGSKISYIPDLPFIKHVTGTEFSTVRNRERYEYVRTLVDQQLDETRRLQEETGDPDLE